MQYQAVDTIIFQLSLSLQECFKVSKRLLFLSVSSVFSSPALCGSSISPLLSARPPTGSSADSAARPHTVGSGQAP